NVSRRRVLARPGEQVVPNSRQVWVRVILQQIDSNRIPARRRNLVSWELPPHSAGIDRVAVIHRTHLAEVPILHSGRRDGQRGRDGRRHQNPLNIYEEKRRISRAGQRTAENEAKIVSPEWRAIPSVPVIEKEVGVQLVVS